MSDPEDREPEKRVGLTDEDKELIEAVMEESGLGSDPGSKARSETSVKTVPGESDNTLQQVHKQFTEILSFIEENVESTEAAIDGELEKVISVVTKELQTIGLGVFATRAASVVKNRLKENLNAKQQVSSILNAIKEAKSRLDSMVLTTSSGITLQVFQTAEEHQNRLVQLYAKLNELDKQLESTAAEVRIWRSKASEQEELIRLKDEALQQSQKNIEDLRTSLTELRTALEEKTAEIAEMKGQIEKSQVQLGSQKDLLAQLGTPETIAKEYESRIEELASIRGQIMVYEDKLMQRDAAIDILKKEIAELEAQKEEFEKKIESVHYESAEWKGIRDAQEAEIESLKAQLKEMESRWDALYQIAEDEPAFKAYFIIAGKTNWLPLQHLSSALGIPTILLKRQLQKFVDAGLVEIEDDKIRPLSLSMPEGAESKDTLSEDET